MGLCLLLFAVHIVWAVIRSFYYDAGQPGTFWIDDQNYYIEAAAISDAWRNGFYPEIWRKGSLPYLGTLHTGYHRPLATLFLVTGPSTLAGLLLNAMSLSVLPLLAALSARYLFLTDDDLRVLPKNDQVKGSLRDISLIAATLTALHPAQFYWTSYLMKDAFTSFVFLGNLTFILGSIRRKSLLLGLAELFTWPFLFTVRIYAAGSLALGAALYPVLRWKTKQIAWGGALLAGTAILVCAYTETGNVLYRQMRDSLAALAPAEVSTSSQMLWRLMAGIPRVFLSPYAWLILPEPSPLYGLYPGMWYLYIIGYPLAFCGIYYTVKDNNTRAVFPLMALAVGGLIFLAASFGGNASRQRYYLEYIILLFATAGFVKPNRRIIAGVLALEICWIIGQVIALRASN